MTIDVETPDTLPATSPAATSSLGDPLGLGLGSFGVSVLLLAITQAGLVDSAVLPVSVLAISLTAGGLGHVLAGVLHFVRGETFPGTVFLTYASFWLSYVLIVQVYAPQVATAGGDPNTGIAWFLTAFSLVTIYFLVSSVATTKILTLLFFLLTVAMILTAAATFAGSSGLATVGGWVLIADALTALYLAAALSANGTWARNLLPTP